MQTYSRFHKDVRIRINSVCMGFCSFQNTFTCVDILVVILASAAAAAKSLQSCPTLCDPIDGSPPGSSVPGILQARILEWVAISFSSAWKWKVKVKSFSHARLFVTPWTAAYQAPPSMGISRQEYWSGGPLPSAMLCYAKLLQSCPTLCNPIDGSPRGSSIHGIFQARVLEWGAIAFSHPHPADT